MLQCIRHRGPDDEGRFESKNLAMGMRRLSIIDLSGGHQPIFNEDNTIAVVFNGEIYNYVELREELDKRGHRFKTNTDTEILIHLYEDEGVEFLPKLNGMFGFSIWDIKNERLFVVRDRLGVKPMYYANTPKGLLYATELKSILATGKVSRELAPGMLFDYLTYYYLPGEMSPFKDIHKLLPGHFILADRNGVKIQRWWNLSEHMAPTKMSRQDATAHVRELFLDSVRLRMRSDVPVGAYLSGGLDSSIATAAAARQTDIQFESFSVGFSQSEFDELPYAREVAKHVGTKHHEIQITPKDALENLPALVWFMDEPNGDSALLPTYLVSKLAVENVKVALSGIGADELFGGYARYHRRLGKFEQLGGLPKPLLRLFRPLFSGLRYEWGQKIDRMIEPSPAWKTFLEKTHQFDISTIRALTGDEDRKCGEYIQGVFSKYQANDFVNHRMFVDAHSYLPDQILSLTDRMSMGVSLEARAPYLDYRLVEFAHTLPGEWKVSGNDWKIIMKDALGDLVPPSLLTRPKWGFASPVQNWMRKGLLDPLIHMCENSHLAKSGALDAKALKTFVKDPVIREHCLNWLWAVGILEIWYRIYVESDGFTPPECGLVEFAEG
jgi:asparagine synthase (glutamine-hydrolysing)